MKKLLNRRNAAIALAGSLSAWLWVWLSLQWALLVEPSLFHWLYRIIGTNGPPLLAASNIAFALLTALAFALSFLWAFKRTWAVPSAIFLASFGFGAALQSIWSGSPVTYVLTYGPLWLFVACFALINSVWPTAGLAPGPTRHSSRPARKAGPSA